jgi:hypothetical protein
MLASYSLVGRTVTIAISRIQQHDVLLYDDRQETEQTEVTLSHNS